MRGVISVMQFCNLPCSREGHQLLLVSERERGSAGVASSSSSYLVGFDLPVNRFLSREIALVCVVLLECWSQLCVLVLVLMHFL